MKLCTTAVFVILILLSRFSVAAPDEFDGINCKSNVPAKLKGRISWNGPVIELEARHKDIGLVDEGADDISKTDEDPLAIVYWEVCGTRYVAIYRQNVIVDAIKIPAKSDELKESTGKCKLRGEIVDDFVLRLSGGGSNDQAWALNKFKGFIRLPASELDCQS